MPNDGDWKTLFPYEPSEISLDGNRYAYVDVGEGEPLLLVHGNPTWSFYWRNLIAGLKDHYRCIAVDHIGCDRSDKPADYQYTLARHTGNLKQLIERLDLKGATLLAHDWGGAIGLGAAVDLPDRFSRIVLFNTAAFPPPFIPFRIRVCRTPLVGKIAVRGLNLFARAALSMAVEKPERMTPAVRAGFLAPYDNWANRVAVEAFVSDIPITPRHPTWAVLERLEERLAALADLPALFIWGMRDWCFNPACLDRLLEHLPRAEVERLSDAGHYVVEDAHEVIVPRLKKFLAQPL